MYRAHDMSLQAGKVSLSGKPLTRPDEVVLYDEGRSLVQAKGVLFISLEFVTDLSLIHI